MLTIKFSYVFLNYLIIHEMYTSWNLSGPAGTLSTLRFQGKTTLHADCKLNYNCSSLLQMLSAVISIPNMLHAAKLSKLLLL